jgi:peptidoglycan/xylan/chitin deacetylase (PgdA/CDA1 family)
VIPRVAALLALAGCALGSWTLGWLPGTAAVGLSGAAGGLLVGLLVVASAQPGRGWFGPTLVRARHPGGAVLTFDDGPHPDSTPPILAALRARGGRATFFVLADRARRWPELIRAMIEEGHEVALHGRSHHPWLTTWSPARGAADLRAALAELRELGVETRWFRPPFGAVSPRLYAAAALAGLDVVWCTVRTGDGVELPDDTLRARCRVVVGTDIVLLHEGPGRPAARLLGEILDEWASRGVRALSLREGMEAGT